MNLIKFFKNMKEELIETPEVIEETPRADGTPAEYFKDLV